MKRDAARLTLVETRPGVFQLTSPQCACNRLDDLDEVHTMIAADEGEIARDELLYLVADCQGFIEAHNLLGDLAVQEEDLSLARGHYGFAYESVLQLLPAKFRGRLLVRFPLNAEFFRAGRGLARCLATLGKLDDCRAVLEQLQRLDPEEPDTKELLGELESFEKTGTKPGGSDPLLYQLSMEAPPPLEDEEDDDD